MGAFDKIVAAVSPRRACEREAWRQQLETCADMTPQDMGA